MQDTIIDNSIQQGVKPRRTQSGIATTDVVCSSYVVNNDEVFSQILDLYAQESNTIADITHGKGVFWRKIDTSRYNLHVSDIKTGTDCRALPYGNAIFNMVVFDPPYMEGLFRKDTSHLAGGGTYKPFRDFYSNGDV